MNTAEIFPSESSEKCSQAFILLPTACALPFLKKKKLFKTKQPMLRVYRGGSSLYYSLEVLPQSII